ncbi:MAG: hypothetical protein HFI63_12060 [Lachnospiraceae bacterium]|nr:hypothetical protein [Lachnospiraceae bacterium]
MKYTGKFFRDTFPEWKKRKDSLIGRYLLRPISFYCSAFCANHGLSANTVSYISAIVAIIGSILFYPDNFICNLTGAILINIWSLLDCIDGNLARSVKKQPFGEFADAVSSYLLVAFMCTAFGFCAYQRGGSLIAAGNSLILIAGALASTFDTVTRLVYQKYKNSEHDLIENGVICKQEDLNKDHDKTGSLAVKLQESLGVSGWLPVFALLAVVIDCMDLLVLYCFLLYGVFFVAGIVMYLLKAIKIQKEVEKRH